MACIKLVGTYMHAKDTGFMQDMGGGPSGAVLMQVIDDELTFGL